MPERWLVVTVVSFFILMFFEFMNEIDILGDRFLFFNVKLGVKTMRATIKRGFCQVLIEPPRGNYRRNLNLNVTTKFCENIDTIKAISREAGSCFSIFSRLCYNREITDDPVI